MREMRMSAKTLIADGFWLCLRPSFGQLATKRAAVPSPSRKRVVVSACRPNSSAATSTPPPSRRDGLFTGVRFHGADAPRTKEKRVVPPNLGRAVDWISPKQWKTRGQPPPRNWTRDSNEKLEDMLQDSVTPLPNYLACMRIMRELIEKRGVFPTARHYRAAIRANMEPRRGSPSQVRALLEEMEENDIIIDSRTLHAALKVLAVHPDYILRQEILAKLRDQWISLSPSGWHDVAVGYIRERQYEMALRTLSHMEAQHIPVQDWLYGLLIYNLCDAEEFNEALRLMKSRLAGGYSLSPNLWFRVLDMAANALHEDLTKFIWGRRVETGYINPSFGVCNNVLTIASRSGNFDLASSVFRLLGERNVTFSLNDYEALIDTYTAAGDVESAVRVLCLMRNTGVGATPSSTQSILTHFLWDEVEPLEMWEMLKRLDKEGGLEIPTVAADVIIELCIRLKDAEAAMQIYRELHLVCPDGSTTDTFNHLLSVCRRAARPDMASFYLAEMRRANLLPNQATYENLIFICTSDNRYEDARNYIVEMTQSGFDLSRTSRSRIQNLCSLSTNEAATSLRITASMAQPISRSTDPRRWQKLQEEPAAEEVEEEELLAPRPVV